MKFLLVMFAACWMGSPSPANIPIKNKWVCEVVIDVNYKRHTYFVTRVVNAKDSIQADSIFQVFIRSEKDFRYGQQALYKITSLRDKIIN